MKFTARDRLETWAHASRVQSEQETYDMEITEMSKDAPLNAAGGPFAWLVQSTTERNPPHGWAVHMFNGQDMHGAIPVYLKQEVDHLRSERDEHAIWRRDLADKLHDTESELAAVKAENEALRKGAKE